VAKYYKNNGGMTMKNYLSPKSYSNTKNQEKYARSATSSFAQGFTKGFGFGGTEYRNYVIADCKNLEIK
jgi:hypothetical protein